MAIDKATGRQIKDVASERLVRLKVDAIKKKPTLLEAITAPKDSKVVKDRQEYEAMAEVGFKRGVK